MTRLLYASVFVMATLCSAREAWAQEFKVEKVKGNKAIIEYSGGFLGPGHTYSFSSSSKAEDHFSPVGERHHLVGLGASFSSLAEAAGGAAGNSNTTMSLNSRFGWNLETMEFGPILQYSSTSAPSSSTYSAGAFGDYNFTANRPGVDGIFGVGAQVDVGSQSSTTNATIMEILPSGFYKWFPTANPFCFRFDVGYLYEKTSYTGGSSLTTAGFEVKAGITEYF